MGLSPYVRCFVVSSGFLCIVLMGVLCLSTLSVSGLLAQESVCAKVSMHIEQTVSLERQAFEASMRISNGAGSTPLDAVTIQVNFTDGDGNPVVATSDPNSENADFFITVDSLDGISAIDGTGIVQADSVAEIRWLIIPAPGASKGTSEGTLYYVGANLEYSISGNPQAHTVKPDYIYVKPMPTMTIDYFLPEVVLGDDPFTDEIEPSVPFSFGVRVSNTGEGIAKRLKIETARLKIVENELNLLTGYTIVSAEVNDEPSSDSLLVEFGDIAAGTAGVAHWKLTCPLLSRCSEFSADWTHSDELGGELTSLIDDVNVHTLIHTVKVDFPVSDAVHDFLATDGALVKVYESNAANSPVEDFSLEANFFHSGTNGTEEALELSFPATSSLCYVKLPDPFNGEKLIRNAVRSDGKVIDKSNVWLSKRKVDGEWEYSFHIFDSASTGMYTIVFDGVSAFPQPPVLQFIADRYCVEGQEMSFILAASDPQWRCHYSLSRSSACRGSFSGQW